ncbi:MAG: ATP-binding protein [Pseudomonadota bacterium]
MTSTDQQRLSRVLSHDLAALVRSARQLSAYAREDVLREDADSAMHAIGMLDVRLANIDRFVSELIRFYRAGERPYRAEPFSITELIHALFKNMCPQEDAQLRLMCTRDVMIADRQLVQTTLRELMKNAVTHRDSSVGIQISVEVTHCDDQTVSIGVEDNGPGVAESLIGTVKQPFVKANGRGNSGSAGLGLAICERDLNAAGGTLHVRNGEHAGVRAEFRIPGGLEAAANNRGRPMIEPVDKAQRPKLKAV